MEISNKGIRTLGLDFFVVQGMKKLSIVLFLVFALVTTV